ncbi:hypothetical protein MTO96_051250 [Rhipicephalus appendiculatus]
MPFRRTFIDGLSEFLASTSNTDATMTQQIFHREEDALAFVQGLRRNKTITTLSFELMLLGAEPEATESFTAVAHPIIGALIENTLTKLSIVRCLLKGEDMELIPGCSARTAPTSFNMINCDGPGGPAGSTLTRQL